MFLRGKLGSVNIVAGMSRSRQCSDPRDKIFAILSLSTLDWPYSDIDYKKSVQDVFSDFSSKIPLQSLLHSLEDPSTRLDNKGGATIYSAGIQGECSFRRLDSQDSKILAVSGFVVDTVDAIGADYDEMTEGSGLLDSLRLLEENLGNGSAYEDIVEAF
ncbi:hypothetical protein V2G26_004989 [Clonostachys chloroleuca]